MASFRVALSGDFRKADGSPAYPDFDLGPLETTPGLEYAYVPVGDGVLKASDLEGFDALILLAARMARESFPGDGRLSAVARFGVGYDNVDVQACSDHAVAAVITPDGVRRPVAVSILAFILALTGKMLIKDRLTRQGPPGWAQRSQHMGVGLVGLTLGSLGIGNIGAEMFRMAKPFDMRAIAHDPYADPRLAAELGIELVGIEDLFRRADILTVNCPLSEATRGIVDGPKLALMKPTAFFINTARGPIVDQKALTKVLQERRIAGAGLDVFEVEPTAADEPLLALDNVILTPHALCWTDQCFAGNGAADVRAVLDIMRGQAPRGIVNRAVADDPAFKAKLDRYRAQFGGR